MEASRVVWAHVVDACFGRQVGRDRARPLARRGRIIVRIGTNVGWLPTLSFRISSPSSTRNKLILLVVLMPWKFAFEIRDERLRRLCLIEPVLTGCYLMTNIDAGKLPYVSSSWFVNSIVCKSLMPTTLFIRRPRPAFPKLTDA